MYQLLEPEQANRPALSRALDQNNINLEFYKPQALSRNISLPLSHSREVLNQGKKLRANLSILRDFNHK